MGISCCEVQATLLFQHAMRLLGYKGSHTHLIYQINYNAEACKDLVMFEAKYIYVMYAVTLEGKAETLKENCYV